MSGLFANFSLDAVRLTAGDLALRRQLVKIYIAAFDVDRLMHTFKLNAGIPSSAEPLKGWEAEDCGLRGHFAGHFLSACAKFALADQDQALRVKADEIVAIMTACARPNGYLSAFGEEQLDLLESEENRKVWAPYYTLHKIMQGLMDCHVYLNHPEALKLAVNLAHYIHGRFKKLSFWKIDGILRCTKVNPANEFGGMGDALYSLHDLTGDAKILELARLFDRDYFLARLADGQDVLENLHANTHLPMIIAAMHRYDMTGEETYKTAALHFYDCLRGRTFANGNSSSKAAAPVAGGVSEKSEHWGGCGRLEDALTGGESESCCAHNTERILERLLSWSWSEAVEYLDHMESLKYNAILNSASSKTGLSQYHQPMGSGASKTFSSPYDSFWCCTASGIEAMSELQKNIWFKSEDMLLLNSFIASMVEWKEKQAKITQHTHFPDSLASTLVIQIAKPALFTLLLKEKAVKAVKINDIPVGLQKENGYIVIQRVFHDQDTIEIEIDAYLHLVPLQGSNSRAAVMYGNILLAQLGQSALLKGVTEHNIQERFIRLPQDQLAFAAEDEEGHQFQFIPLFRVEEETYSVYLDLENDPSADKRFSIAEVGSAAYENEIS
ncbi:beta-L-arabinofuranosidase domain-containing protein [Paenibacillus pabuli]|uniref:beta-L-arabinofuranosidase domain-containing protein n=1 Tax=Paenibacillus pabuli TaxID=1472 RepID=UPI001FFEB57C|nr:beta-L-arabinofuranosidase domain-containing protein [Paenibacillus pabuli]